MKIDWYTLCYNEEFIIPWIIQYWEKLINDGIDLHIYVYDNNSTDKSVEMLSQYDWITINYFTTSGQDDIIQAQIKNSVWQNSKGKADFVVVSDFDEIIWSNNITEVLEDMKKDGYNVLGAPWYAFCGDEIPTFDENKYLHQLVKKGYKQTINHQKDMQNFGKFMLFDPNLIDNMNYSVGCHIANPYPYMKLYETDKVVEFHINKGLSEDYFVNRRKAMNENLSETNKKFHMCYEYGFSENKSREEYQRCQRDSIDISKL